jgi:DNA-binding MarR family transcriptional regulator
MLWGSTPEALANRFSTLAQNWVADGPAARAERARRKLISEIAAKEPATLNQIAAAVGRGAPAVSRAVDALVRAGLVERTQDPNNRRRLALRVTERGREELANLPKAGSGLGLRLERLAHSELRAIERAIEILERAS